MHQRIKAWVKENRERMLEANRRLVAIDSQNLVPFGREKAVQLEVKRQLEELGFATDLFTPDEVEGIREHEAFLADGRVYADRPNVVGVWKGRGSGRSLLFSGHMDTVPLGEEPWTRDPFGGETADGKQYGLGIFDMKGGMSAAILAARCLREIGAELDGDLLIESVVDEEFGGANGTLACRLRGYAADAAIIPEPTNLTVCPANQGGAYYRVWFEGASGRAYSGEALVDPVAAAARFIGVVGEYGRWRNARGDAPPGFEGQQLATIVQAVHAGDKRFDLGDRVPRTCYVDVWLQCWPGVEEGVLFEEFARFVRERMGAGDAGAAGNAGEAPTELRAALAPRFEKKMRFLPGTAVNGGHPIVPALLGAGRKVRGGGLRCAGAPFACDAFIFNRYSETPAVIFGPAGGNAHSADEFILIDEFFEMVGIFALTIAGWCGARIGGRSGKGGAS